jgi:hypothetical protein
MDDLLSKYNSKTSGEKRRFLGRSVIAAVVGVIVLAVIANKYSPPQNSATPNLADSYTIQESIMDTATLSEAGYQLAQDIYNKAASSPEAKQMTAQLVLEAPDGLVDHYGKQVPGPYIMGDIAVTNLDEVRKYADYAAYALDTKATYAIQIKDLKYAELLKNE